MVSGDYVRPYQLGRPELSIGRALQAIDRACSLARKVEPEQALGEFQLIVGGLLPTAAGNKGERWRPDRDASEDDWVRLAVYLGALDSFRQQTRTHIEPQDQRTAFVYMAAYSMAWAATGSKMTQPIAVKSAKEVRRG